MEEKRSRRRDRWMRSLEGRSLVQMTRRHSLAVFRRGGPNGRGQEGTHGQEVLGGSIVLGFVALHV